MKAQALIVQFIIFFLIGLSLFLSIGNFFKYQLEIFRSDASFFMRKLISSYVSSAIISSLACKQCDFVNSTLKLQNTLLGYFIELSLSSQGLNISSVPENKQYLSSIHNLNSSLSLAGKSSSVKPIIFTFDRTQNKVYFESITPVPWPINLPETAEVIEDHVNKFIVTKTSFVFLNFSYKGNRVGIVDLRFDENSDEDPTNDVSLVYGNGFGDGNIVQSLIIAYTTGGEEINSVFDTSDSLVEIRATGPYEIYWHTRNNWLSFSNGTKTKWEFDYWFRVNAIERKIWISFGIHYNPHAPYQDVSIKEFVARLYLNHDIFSNAKYWFNESNNGFLQGNNQWKGANDYNLTYGGFGIWKNGRGLWALTALSDSDPDTNLHAGGTQFDNYYVFDGDTTNRIFFMWARFSNKNLSPSEDVRYYLEPIALYGNYKNSFEEAINDLKEEGTWERYKNRNHQYSAPWGSPELAWVKIVEGERVPTIDGAELFEYEVNEGVLYAARMTSEGLSRAALHISEASGLSLPKYLTIAFLNNTQENDFYSGYSVIFDKNLNRYETQKDIGGPQPAGTFGKSARALTILNLPFLRDNTFYLKKIWGLYANEWYLLKVKVKTATGSPVEDAIIQDTAGKTLGKTENDGYTVIPIYNGNSFTFVVRKPPLETSFSGTISGSDQIIEVALS